MLRSIREVKQDWRSGREGERGESVSAKHGAFEKVTGAVRATKTVVVGPSTGERNELVWSSRRDWTTTVFLSRKWRATRHVLLTGFRVSSPAVLPCSCYCHTAFAPQIMCHANVEACCCRSPAARTVNWRFIGKT